MASLLDRIRERSRAHARATSMGGVTTYPPTTLAAVEAAEAKMGLRLPPLLREIYTQIANGGVGPGFGLVGVAGSPYCPCWFAYTVDSVDLAEAYLDFASSEDWPAGLVPICDWGCAYFSAVDCADPRFPVVFCGQAWAPHSPSFDAWIEDWLDDVDLWERGLDAEWAVIEQERASQDDPGGP